ncbi:uncharacterized protein LOC128390178 [Panonychus citri]|uniref:uncharacterized protein LOC128390178 n=1 Tax=Panonychus citri TaxID=50023 RepID=UPI002306F376|nr:uncharacterized protein LOC128390178 [Panonychus citri]
MILCPCCQRQYDVLPTYLVHQCDCRFNPCKMMDFMEGPPSKRPRLEPTQSSSSSSCSSCSNCSDCSLCAEALRNMVPTIEQIDPQQPELFPEPPIRVESEEIILSSQSTIDLSSDEEDEQPMDLSVIRPSVIQFAPRIGNEIFSSISFTNIDSPDINEVMTTKFEEIRSLINTLIDEFGAIKFSIGIIVQFKNETTEKTDKGWFESDLTPCLAGSNKDSLTNDSYEFIYDRIDQFTQRGSGWTVNKILSIDLAAGKFKPFRGGCNDNQIPLFIRNKKCLISPQTDTDCFMFAVLIGLHKSNGHCGRTSNYTQYVENYDFSDVRGIVSIDKIDRFSRKNNLSINVYTCYPDSKAVVPLQICDQEKEKHVDLFLMNQHYYTISNFNRLVSHTEKRARFFCKRCLCSFSSSEKQAFHLNECQKVTAQRLILPDVGNSTLKRNQFRKEVQFPVCVYADFETLNVKNTSENNTVSDLVPCSYGLVVVDWNGEIISKDFYLGENAGVKFLEKLISLESFIRQHISTNIKPLSLTSSEEKQFKEATVCHICSKPLGTNTSVRDHDHLTGKFRGAAHQLCNLEYQVPTQIPVVFHNLKNFDGHIIIKALSSSMFTNKPQIIAHSTEKFIGFIIDNFKFMDSFAFLPASLDALSANLSTDDKVFYLSQLFMGDLSLLMKKGCLPYEYLDSFDRFTETSLPSRDQFYSSLMESPICDEIYNHVREVWSHFGCVTLKDLHDVYLKTDVVLLTAVFENFRKMALTSFGIDPLHHFSSPGLTWAAALKTTAIELQIFSDVDMLLMIESGIRGGLTMVSKRYAKANDPELPDYNPKEPNSKILYLDVNNLYGYAMSQYLPVDGYEWCDILLEDILNTSDVSSVGYILEVDLEYPSDLHDSHSDFPLIPEKRKVDSTMYSSYQQELHTELRNRGIKLVSSTKLVTTFLQKIKYVVHYSILKYYVELGIKITKVHRVIKFNQSPWLAQYVNFCTLNRQRATSDFEKDFWKLLVNSIYGKTIEDKRKHLKVEIALKDIEAERMMRKNLVKKFIILDEDKVIFQMKNSAVKMDKPIAVGFTVLELAKLKMFKLHYGQFKPHFGDNMSLLYTDTDSLIYHLKTDNINHDLQILSHLMDFSNYPQSHNLFSNENKKKIGFVKNEVAGDEILEFIGIKPKLYALKTLSGVKKRAKGVPRVSLNKITFDDFHNCLMNESTESGTASRIQSTNHNIQVVSQTKLMITPFEDKRFYLNKIESVPYGHYNIKNLL